MTTKTLVRLLVVLAILAGLFLLTKCLKNSSRGGSGGSGSSKGSLIEGYDANEVHGFRISQDGETTELVDKDGTWVVSNRDDYGANYDEVRDLVMKLKNLERIKTERSVAEANLGRYGLAMDGEEPPTKVEVLDKEGAVSQTLYLGGSQQSSGGGSGSGRYLRVGDDSAVHLIKERFNDLKAGAGDWVSKDFFKVENIRTVSLQSPNPEDSWKVARPSAEGEFVLADAKPGEEGDPSKTSSFKWMLGSPSFDDVLSAEEAAKIDFGIATSQVAEIETFDGFKYVLSIAKQAPAEGEGEGDAKPQHFIKVDVDAAIQETRTPGAEETEEQAKTLDEAHVAVVAGLKEKLDAEQKLKGRVYQISEYTVSSLLKKRSDLLVQPDAPAGAPAGAPGLPPGIVPPTGAPPAPPAPPAGRPAAPKPQSKQQPAPSGAGKPKANPRKSTNEENQPKQKAPENAKPATKKVETGTSKSAAKDATDGAKKPAEGKKPAQGDKSAETKEDSALDLIKDLEEAIEDSKE